jgi:hypothetical protein
MLILASSLMKNSSFYLNKASASPESLLGWMVMPVAEYASIIKVESLFVKPPPCGPLRLPLPQHYSVTSDVW